MYNVAGLYTYFIWNMEDDITGSRKLPNRISRHWNETSQYNGETRNSTKIDLRQELLIGNFLRFFFLTKTNTSKTRIQICEQKIPRLFIFFLIWNKFYDEQTSVATEHIVSAVTVEFLSRLIIIRPGRSYVSLSERTKEKLLLITSYPRIFPAKQIKEQESDFAC